MRFNVLRVIDTGETSMDRELATHRQSLSRIDSTYHQHHAVVIQADGFESEVNCGSCSSHPSPGKFTCR